MALVYHIDPQRNIPIYQQLVDEISADIKSGRTPHGTQLPTVQEMADTLDIARGTIKRAYDELEQQGLVEKVQGRGTFVCYRSADLGNRKEQAMAAIDALFDRLAELDFSLAEVGIFLDLKLREREAGTPNVKVAVVGGDAEGLAQISDQLRQIGQIELYTYLLDDVLAYPYKLGEEMDLVVTTTDHYAPLRQALSDQTKLARIALRLSARSMAQLVKLPDGQRVGTLSGSEHFAGMMRDTCELYADHLVLTDDALFSRELDCAAFLANKDAVLVPEDYERLCSQETLETLSAWEQQGRLIRCAYRVDEGSLIYLREKIERLREHRKI